jgi:ribosomal-protein-alanine N-acetyltransferase
VDIIPMGADHVDEILAIEEVVFPTPWTRGMFEQEIARRDVRQGPGSYSVVAIHEREVAAYSMAWILLDEVHLVNIAVRPDFQESGIGTLLLNHLIDVACRTDKTIITLEVRESNTIAQAFYRGFLFREIGVRRGYYSDNRENAVLMVLDLSPIIERRRLGQGKPNDD